MKSKLRYILFVLPHREKELFTVAIQNSTFLSYYTQREMSACQTSMGHLYPKRTWKNSCISTFYLYCFNFKQNSNSITNSKLKPFSNPEEKMFVFVTLTVHIKKSTVTDESYFAHV